MTTRNDNTMTVHGTVWYIYRDAGEGLLGVCDELNLKARGVDELSLRYYAKLELKKLKE